MRELLVGLGERSYPIIIENGLLKNVGKDLAKRKVGNRYCVIADENVATLYGEILLKSLEEYKLDAELITFPAGEASKNLSTFSRLSSEIAQKKFDRKDAIIALGGGVTGDLAGFIASSYMRGIPFVQIPTTLLSQVDSSVGGKTGVDIPEGKNLVGAFYQPQAVYIDTAVLHTLPASELLGGMAEVIKYGVIRDQNFFEHLRKVKDDVLGLSHEVIAEIIETCCSIKADVVAEDEEESNVRRILNYGHTIGHAVEAVSDFSIIHGNAVAIGMAAIARIAKQKKLLTESQKNEIISLLEEYGLPTEIPEGFDVKKIKDFLLTDKKVVSGKVVYVLPVKIGDVVITSDVEEEFVSDVLSGKLK